MKFIHIADIHASRERYELIKSVFNTLTERCSEGDIDFVCIAGDFWDSAINNSKASHFTEFVSMMYQLAVYTKVIMIYGTPSHDVAGSLEVFKYSPNIYILGLDSENEGKEYLPSFTKLKIKDNTVEFIGLPEPRLSLTSGENTEVKENKIEKYLNDFIFEVPPRDSSTTARICLFHNEVAGLKYQNGVEMGYTKTNLSIKYLGQLDCDYYCGGHIHNYQQLGFDLKGGYCGSSAPINFGEEHDASYILVEV